MQKRIQEIIVEEDQKNPLSDSKIAKLLNVTREKVIALRSEAGIPNYRQRRLQAMEHEAYQILQERPHLSERAFAAALKTRGYMVSRYAASTVRNQLQADMSEIKIAKRGNFQGEESAETLMKQAQSDSEGAFGNIIGKNGGMQVQINQAKAAILYPPFGLNTLITGPSGVGKSYLAESMYSFAKEQGVIGESGKFVVFNCADYADNPQLLLAQLFGYRKGAFSGASVDKAGLVEKANQGILFLDEIHRLPSEGQEILFSILDKGEFRRLGETQSIKVNVRIIAATTENVESSLLLTFRRRIPMIIDIPSLSERPLAERYELVRQFFMMEAAQTKKTIRVDEKVLRYLLLYKCPGNIGQLLSDIRVACANAFLYSVSKNRGEVSVRIRNLAKYEEFSVTMKKQEEQIRAYVAQPLVIDQYVQLGKLGQDQTKWKLETIYDTIEDDVSELRNIGIDDAKINEILQRKIKDKIKAYVLPEENMDKTIEELCSVVDTNIVTTVREAVDVARKYIPKLQMRVYYFLSIHLSTFYDRMSRGIYRKFSLDIKNISARYQKEYEVACIISRDISAKLSMEFPQEEIGMIAMYLYTFSHEDSSEESRVKVLVMSHGRVASAMVQVANRLLNMNYAIGIDMDFNETPDAMLEKIVNVVEEVDTGKGCLLLVDIGSLTSIDERVTARTGIPCICVDRVDTAMVLEAVRRAALTSVELEELAAALQVDKYGKQDITEPTKPTAILFVCITGEGTARRLEEYISQFKSGDLLRGVKTFNVSALDSKRLKAEVAKFRQMYHIVASVGSMKPLGTEAPFISAQEIFSGEGIKRLQQILEIEMEPVVSLRDVLNESSVVCNLDLSDKTQIIDYLSNILKEQGFVDDDFLLSAYKRESTGATYLSGGIGIPHGGAEYVKKSAMAVASLVRPVLWENNFMVDLVVLLAFKESDQKYINELYHIISNKNALKLLKEAGSAEKIIDVLLKKQF